MENSRQLMEEHQKIYLYLDRDLAGVKNTESALLWSDKYVDKSDLYKNHKDLNDYLKSQHSKINQGLKAGRHL